MTNSIDSYVDGAIHRLADRRTDTAHTKADGQPGAGGTAGTPDLLDLTGKAQTLKALEQDLARAPEFDAGRVAELKEAISGGSYKVDSLSIAEKLLDMESRLP